ncbi:hypothetical protein HAX54_035317, partial [Datura stramonium]|nr:hypothetical protein [Datura stramonium]
YLPGHPRFSEQKGLDTREYDHNRYMDDHSSSSTASGAVLIGSGTSYPSYQQGQAYNIPGANIKINFAAPPRFTNEQSEQICKMLDQNQNQTSLSLSNSVNMS